MLDGNGAVILRWKCRQPHGAQGTVYQVYRSIGADGPFEFVGCVGEKRYVDATVPAGATRLTYRVRAVRSTKVGPWASFPVNFGSNGEPALPAGMRAAA
ncbi:MAG: hypothetical protein QM760_19335 [Nibricoccus sp.]